MFDVQTDPRPASRERHCRDIAAFEAPRLDVLRLELLFAIDEAVVLPANRGNMWRGIFGAALKRIDEGVLPGLSTGLIDTGRLYETFFEPEVSAGVVGGINLHGGAPHPYVVDAPAASGYQEIPAGATERIGLTLIGKPASAVEAVLAAFDFAARVGLGAGQGRQWKRGRAHLMETRAVWRNDDAELRVFDDQNGFQAIAAEAPVVPQCPPRLRVILATPLRLIRDGRLVRTSHFQPATLLFNLVRRVASLSALYGTSVVDADSTTLKRLCTSLVAEQPALAFADQTRWSGNHQQEIDAGGIIGSFVLDMRGAEPLFPYLWLGQWLHAGKGAVCGLGAIRLRPV